MSEKLASALKTWTETVMQQSMHGVAAFAHEEGLSMSQIGALFFIRQHDASGMSTVAGRLGVSNAAASQLLDRLVRRGLVRRAEDPDDRRFKRLELTEDGERLASRIMEVRQKWFARLAEVLPPQDQDRAAEVLTLLTEAVGRLSESETGGPEGHGRGSHQGGCS